MPPQFAADPEAVFSLAFRSKTANPLHHHRHTQQHRHQKSPFRNDPATSNETFCCNILGAITNCWPARYSILTNIVDCSLNINQKKMKSVAKEYTSMKCKEKEDLIEIRVSVNLFSSKHFCSSRTFFLELEFKTLSVRTKWHRQRARI